MKKLFGILLLSALASKSKAQTLEILNARHCTIYVVMRGECPGGACDGVAVTFNIPPGASTFVPTFAAASIAPFFVAGGSCSTPSGFVWHYAEIQSVECMPCSGFGVSIGDGTCHSSITGAIRTSGPNCETITTETCPGETQCAKWQTFDGGVKITAY